MSPQLALQRHADRNESGPSLRPKRKHMLALSFYQFDRNVTSTHTHALPVRWFKPVQSPEKLNGDELHEHCRSQQDDPYG